MTTRDYETAPVSDGLALDTIIKGLSSDLDELRAGRISVNDAIARSLLAKQIFNGVRLYLNASKALAGVAKEVGGTAPAIAGGEVQTARPEAGAVGR